MRKFRKRIWHPASSFANIQQIGDISREVLNYSSFENSGQRLHEIAGRPSSGVHVYNVIRITAVARQPNRLEEGDSQTGTLDVFTNVFICVVQK